MSKRNENLSQEVRIANNKRSKYYKEKRSEILGESIDGAWYKLRKMILFNQAKESGKDICCRCHKKIENIDEFSIDHIESWEKSYDPKKSFYDMNNIAYSHERCNYLNDGSQRFRIFNSKSGLRGVTQVGERWKSSIKKDRKSYSLGTFDTKEEAGKAYDDKAKEYWGDKAVTNKSLGNIKY
jgi:AP2 domain.